MDKDSQSNSAPENVENPENKTKKEEKEKKEIGGPKTSDGLEPTRYGDWESNGRAIDF